LKRFIIAAALLAFAATNAAAECSGDEYRMLDRVIGEWDEYRLGDDGPSFMGSLSTERVASGCGFTQTFSSPDGSFTFASLGFLEPGSGWIEHYVLSSGRATAYRWTESGDELILERLTATPGPLRRLVIFDISADEYYVADEESSDGGETWERGGIVHTVRKPHQ
jgi:streptogramin lyase